MSLLYGSLKGQAKTEATRRGNANSGIETHVRGWDSGIRVIVEEMEGHIFYKLYATSGSHKAKHDQHIGTLSEAEIKNNRIRFDVY